MLGHSKIQPTIAGFVQHSRCIAGGHRGAALGHIGHVRDAVGLRIAAHAQRANQRVGVTSHPATDQHGAHVGAGQALAQHWWR
ncbi:hypothetical protein, partial [Acidovorax sp. 24-64-9]|uniref:hypothetical protein n=1 Tax=Acidovorax sp. 24-64-9 TaxID=1970309 RepID=UPI0025BF520A